MSYRARILDLIDDLNYIASDKISFPFNNGKFGVSMKDGITRGADRDEDCVEVYVYYEYRI